LLRQVDTLSNKVFFFLIYISVLAVDFWTTAVAGIRCQIRSEKKNSLIFVISWIFVSSNAILKSFLLLPYVFTPVMFVKILCMYLNMSHSLYRCSFKFPVKVGLEESIVNAPGTTRIKTQTTVRFKQLKLIRNAFTIDSSTPTLTRNLNEHLIFSCFYMDKQ
jgi:hypothetical protein